MKRVREFWPLKVGMRRNNANLSGGDRANGAQNSGADSTVSDEIKRRQISIAVRYVAMTRAR
jgi:hypothetical protein